MSLGVLFSRLLEGFISGPCIEEGWRKVYCLVSLLSVVSKFFEKLVANRIVGHLEKYGLFSDFQYGFRSRSTADLTIASGCGT